jgi:polyisoprenoid-binding protein YceI
MISMTGSLSKRLMIGASGFLISFFLGVGTAYGQMHPVAKESSIRFVIKNFGFNTNGSLGSPTGDISFNPDDLSKSSFSIIIKSESINTENESRDEHLRNEDYFDVKKYPQIRFVSSSFSVTNKKGDYSVTGTLTLKDKSKEIVIPFKAVKNGSGYLFTGSFKMSRRDFDIGGSSTVSNELTVHISVLAQ